MTPSEAENRNHPSHSPRVHRPPTALVWVVHASESFPLPSLRVRSTSDHVVDKVFYAGEHVRMQERRCWTSKGHSRWKPLLHYPYSPVSSGGSLEHVSSLLQAGFHSPELSIDSTSTDGMPGICQYCLQCSWWFWAVQKPSVIDHIPVVSITAQREAAHFRRQLVDLLFEVLGFGVQRVDETLELVGRHALLLNWREFDVCGPLGSRALPRWVTYLLGENLTLAEARRKSAISGGRNRGRWTTGVRRFRIPRRRPFFWSLSVGVGAVHASLGFQFPLLNDSQGSRLKTHRFIPFSPHIGDTLLGNLYDFEFKLISTTSKRVFSTLK